MAFGIGLYDIKKVYYSLEENEIAIGNVIIRVLDLLGKSESISDMDIQGILQKNGYTYVACDCM